MGENGYSFEESDDRRTWTGELVPDCEKAKTVLPVLEYLGEFKALIDACGQVSYYFNMRRFVYAEVNKAKIVAAAYQHDLRYYNDQLNEWREKARRSFGVLTLHADKFGYKFPDRNDFLNGLTVSKDRREAFKDYLRTLLKREQTLSPDELETKFQKRLQRRLRRAAR